MADLGDGVSASCTVGPISVSVGLLLVCMS